MSRRFISVLTAATVSTYLLVALGATLATGDAAGCGSWPGCGGLAVDLPTALALGHRLAALVAFGLVALAAVRARRLGVSRRVQAPLEVATVAFPVQISWAPCSRSESAPQSASCTSSSRSASSRSCSVRSCWRSRRRPALGRTTRP